MCRNNMTKRISDCSPVRCTDKSVVVMTASPVLYAL